MGFLSNVVIGGAALWLVHKAREGDEEARIEREREEAIREAEKEKEEKRRNTPCYFDGAISMNLFDEIVTTNRKRIKRLTHLKAEGPIVYGTVQSQSGISDWNFKIDFNDFGDITGKYWLSSENDDSSIPETVAERISTAIKESIASGPVES